MNQSAKREKRVEKRPVGLSGDANNGVRVGVAGFVNRGLVLVIGAALTRQLIDTERIVNVVRVGTDRMPMRKCWRQKESVMVRVMRVCRRWVMVRMTRSGRTGTRQHIVQSER